MKQAFYDGIDLQLKCNERLWNSAKNRRFMSDMVGAVIDALIKDMDDCADEDSPADSPA